jgi:predicted transglutaminase-like cysteine proteinase
MCNWFNEWLKMRKLGLVQVQIIERTKRREPVNVVDFLNKSVSVELQPNQTLLEWIVANIQYKPDWNKDDRNKDYWNFPDETLADKFGDCEDGAILLANMILTQKTIPYYDVLVNVYDTSISYHVFVTLCDRVLDWTNPSLKTIPPNWKLWYCFNQKHAYTTKENARSWKK